MDRDQIDSSPFNDDPVLHAAQLYHRGDKNQTEVMAVMGISRVMAIKYLQTTQENGLVHISLDVSVFSSVSATLQVRNKFNLQRVIVVPDGEHTGKRDDTKLIQTRLSRAGDMCLNQVIENGDVLRVTQGETIHQMSKTMTSKLYKNVIVIQMPGSMSSQPDLTITESSSQTAYKLSDHVASLHVPAVIPSAGLTMELQAKPIIRSNSDILTHYTKTFFVVGNALDENPLVRVGVLNKKEVQAYRGSGAVGIICGHLYDREGMPAAADAGQHILGISLAQLKQIEREIFLANGERGCDTTPNVLLGGYVTDLIIDEGTVGLLLACELPHQKNEQLPHMDMGQNLIDQWR